MGWCFPRPIEDRSHCGGSGRGDGSGRGSAPPDGDDDEAAKMRATARDKGAPCEQLDVRTDHRLEACARDDQVFPDGKLGKRNR
jgi:hypothetical protein